MKKPSSYFALIGFFLLLLSGHSLGTPKSLPYFKDKKFTPVWSLPKGKPMHQIGQFQLTDQLGKAVSQRQLAGKIVVANFFFPACHGICPTTMKHLKKVQNAFLKDPQVVILSHSLTAETDTPESLSLYAKEQGIQHPKWRLLSGKKNALYDHARKSYFADEDLGKRTAEESFLHTESFFLVDTNGHIRGLYAGTRPAEVALLIQDIKTLKKEKQS